MSPAIEKSDPGYIKGAEAGDLYNSVTRQLYGKEVFIVPIHYSKQWLVWRDKKNGGGFLGAFSTPEEAQARIEQEENQKGLESIDTPVHVCLIVNRESGGADEIVISMPRTKAKISRQWNSMIKMAGGDRFGRVYRVTTNLEENPKGKYYNFAIAQSGFPVKQLYDKAAKLYEAITAGKRKVVIDNDDDDAGHPTSSEM
jgi:hypothetical protein